jgi:hypothetical protein
MYGGLFVPKVVKRILFRPIPTGYVIAIFICIFRVQCFHPVFRAL